MEIQLKDTLNSSWKNDKTGFGFKMLQKMGWSEEKGLGKHETGITNNIKLVRRDEGLGLGMEKVTDGAGLKGWNHTATSFNDVLSVLKEAYGKRSSKKSKKLKTASVSVGMKYKKMSQAKDFSAKTDEEKRAILGAATSFQTIAAISAKSEASEEDGDERGDEKSDKKKKKKKRKREEREESEQDDE